MSSPVAVKRSPRCEAQGWVHFFEPNNLLAILAEHNSTYVSWVYFDIVLGSGPRTQHDRAKLEDRKVRINGK